MAQPKGSKPQNAKVFPGPGFRVRGNDRRPSDNLIERFRRFDTPEISDMMNGLYTMSTAIKPVTDPALKLVGPACTVKCFPGDNLMVHKALDVAAPGDVVVVDTSGSSMTAVLGDTIGMKARHRGIDGYVIDGLVRDLSALFELRDFPVFAKGSTPTGPLKQGPGEINYPICCGGVVVNPGDLIVGDRNGVVVIPEEICPELLDRLERWAEVEEGYLAAVAMGDFDNGWVDRVLVEAGLPLPSELSPHRR